MASSIEQPPDQLPPLALSSRVVDAVVQSWHPSDEQVEAVLFIGH